jgi:hypothetical protein
MITGKDILAGLVVAMVVAFRFGVSGMKASTSFPGAPLLTD